MKELIIFGTDNFADICHFYFTNDSDYKVVGFTVDGDYLQENKFKGLPVVPFEEVEQHFPADRYDMFVAVGIRKVNGFRAEKFNAARARGYRLASFLSSRAIVHPDLSLAPNTMIMEYVTIMPFVEIGCDTIIWPRSGLGFRTRIGNHCWIVAGFTGETVVIGDYTFVGLNATISPFVDVGKSNIIGAGALILRDTKDFEVYRGCKSKPSIVPSTRLRSLE